MSNYFCLMCFRESNRLKMLTPKDAGFYQGSGYGCPHCTHSHVVSRSSVDMDKLLAWAGSDELTALRAENERLKKDVCTGPDCGKPGEVWECYACCSGGGRPCRVTILYENTPYRHVEEQIRFQNKICLCDKNRIPDWRELPPTPQEDGK